MKGRAAAVALFACLPMAAAAADADPEATRRALRPLLTATDAVVPSASSCRGIWAPKGRSTVGDVLSMRLAYLYNGQNVITGRCETGAPERCRVSILHSAGEDVASTRIDFELRRGRLRPDSLRCEFTP